MPRWPTAECSGLLHYLLSFLCFLAAPICIEDGASNSLPGTPIQSLSSFYLLQSSVQILWMLTDFCHWMGHQCTLTINSQMPGSLTSLITEGQSSRSPIWKMWKQGLHLLECENTTLTNLYKVFLQRISSIPTCPLKLTSPSQLTVSHTSPWFKKRRKLVCLISSTF